jgi:hypothetical protein
MRSLKQNLFEYALTSLPQLPVTTGRLDRYLATLYRFHSIL